VRAIVRRVLPAKVRRALRIALRELPHRLHDLPIDLRERLRRAPSPLPPARLRRRVGLTSSRAEFQSVGERAVADLLGAYQAVKPGENGYGKWLDYGCGTGRILLPLQRAGVEDLSGVDPDRGAIRWLQRRYGPERFQELPEAFPLSFPAGSFDVVLAISIFTHLDEAEQLATLAEISRLLRPGGLLIASTHGRELLVTRGDLTPAQIARLDATGFLFAAGGGPFNENSTFHSAEYLARSWGRWLDRRLSLAKGLMNYQDLSVWQARPPQSRFSTSTVVSSAGGPSERI
jgi:SAM-dependent methyltransferase